MQLNSRYFVIKSALTLMAASLLMFSACSKNPAQPDTKDFWETHYIKEFVSAETSSTIKNPGAPCEDDLRSVYDGQVDCVKGSPGCACTDIYGTDPATGLQIKVGESCKKDKYHTEHTQKADRDFTYRGQLVACTKEADAITGAEVCETFDYTRNGAGNSIKIPAENFVIELSPLGFNVPNTIEYNPSNVAIRSNGTLTVSFTQFNKLVGYKVRIKSKSILTQYANGQEVPLDVTQYMTCNDRENHSDTTSAAQSSASGALAKALSNAGSGKWLKN